MTRRIDPGIGSGEILHYTSAITPIIKDYIGKINIHLRITSFYIDPSWIWYIYYEIRDPSSGRLLTYGTTAMPGTGPLNREINIEGFPDILGIKPFFTGMSPTLIDASIYGDYRSAAHYMAEYTDYENHEVEGLSATFNKFITELKGNDFKKPKYFHFAGHGGKENGKPYLLVRDDNYPSQTKKLKPSDIYYGIDKDSLLNHTEMVYFASCYSLKNRDSLNWYDNFVRPLLYHAGAKILMGFTNIVDSRVSMMFTYTFYKHYLKYNKNIYDSVTDAKNELLNPLNWVGVITGISGLVVEALGRLISSLILEIIGVVLGAIASAVALTVVYMSINLDRIRYVQR